MNCHELSRQNCQRYSQFPDPVFSLKKPVKTENCETHNGTVFFSDKKVFNNIKNDLSNTNYHNALMSFIYVIKCNKSNFNRIEYILQKI